MLAGHVVPHFLGINISIMVGWVCRVVLLTVGISSSGSRGRTHVDECLSFDWVCWRFASSRFVFYAQCDVEELDQCALSVTASAVLAP